MNKSDYRSKVANLKQTIKESNAAITETELAYIESNKPCEINDKVEIILASGRKAKGTALTFDILADANVCITSYKEGSRTKFITTPHGEVTIL